MWTKSRRLTTGSASTLPLLYVENITADFLKEGKKRIDRVDERFLNSQL